MLKDSCRVIFYFDTILYDVGYGMTEVVILSHITPLDDPIDNDKHLGSCGKLLPGFEAKVLPPTKWPA